MREIKGDGIYCDTGTQPHVSSIVMLLPILYLHILGLHPSGDKLTFLNLTLIHCLHRDNLTCIKLADSSSVNTEQGQKRKTK